MRWVKQSLRRQLILLILLSLTIPIALSIYVNYRFNKNFLYSQAIEETMGLLSRGGEEIVNYIDSIHRASLSIYSDEEFYRLLTGQSSIIGNDFYYNRLFAIFRLIHETRQVYLYSFINDSSYVMVNGTFKKTSGRSPLIVSNIKPYSFELQGFHNSRNYVNQAPFYGSVPVISLQRPLYRVPTSEKIGDLAIDVEPDVFRRIFLDLNGNLSGDLFLYDDQGAVFYESSSANVHAAFHDSVTRSIFNLSDQAGYFSIKEDHFSGILFFQKIQADGHAFVLVKRISEKMLYAKAHRITLLNSTIALLFLAVAIAAVLLVSFNLTAPILRLIRHMNRIQTGKFNASISFDRQDEIGVLANRFQTMMDTINDLIQSEYKIKLANQLSEIKALQAQINPHFLNNALQSIGSVALEARVPKIYTLISALGQMMYYNMNNKEILVTLDQEVDYTRHYLNLQRQRYQNQFQFRIDIEADTAHLLIPKMTLQPIVENYFKHNLLIKDGMLILKSVIVDDVLHLTVEDNGIGMLERSLLQMENYLNLDHENEETSALRIGLRNVTERLRFYGPATRIHLKPAAPTGLTVTLVIPIRNT